MGQYYMRGQGVLIFKGVKFLWRYRFFRGGGDDLLREKIVLRGLSFLGGRALQMFHGCRFF